MLGLLVLDLKCRRLELLKAARFFAVLATGSHDQPLIKIPKVGKQAANTATPLSTNPQYWMAVINTITKSVLFGDQAHPNPLTSGVSIGVEPESDKPLGQNQAKSRNPNRSGGNNER